MCAAVLGFVIDFDLEGVFQGVDLTLERARFTVQTEFSHWTGFNQP